MFIFKNLNKRKWLSFTSPLPPSHSSIILSSNFQEMRVVGVSSPTHPTQLLEKKKKLVKKSNCILFFGFWHQKGLSLQQKKRRSVFKFLIHENNYIENTYVYFSFNNDREKKMQNKDWDDNTKIMVVSSSSIFFHPLQHLFPFQHALTWLAFSHWRRS